MFRQIRVHSDDQDLQRILWSPAPNVHPVDYRLKTVTYGTACAPFLAMRTVAQLALDEQTHFPLGATCLQKNTYVDDSVIRLVQIEFYSMEIKCLTESKELTKGNSVSPLNPFVDPEDGLLRVGARLEHSSLSRESQHPPILPKQSHLSKLFIHFAHLSSLHGGPTLTLSILQQHVWIPSGRRLVKSEIRSCVTCQRVRPRLAYQLMGDLPDERVNPSRPFTCTGLDYIGPFSLRLCKGRGQRKYKGYVALFICFATRAIHLELVSDLTTLTFLHAYRRFSGRCGVPKHLYSDNGTTFKGAAIELKQMFNSSSEFYQEIAEVLANERTTWSFIPPNAPNCGGLWEAGVKSTKNHLTRVMGEHVLTIVEFCTLLVQIEFCLNSRPQYSLSNEPDDLVALTPAHFLMGTASGLVPDSEPPNVPENCLSRYQLVQRIRDQFWKRWSVEYIHHLQQRAKWRSPSENYSVGQLVLIQDNRYPPSKWPLARVIEAHPGPDGLIRVATVKSALNTLKRHIRCLSPITMPTSHLDLRSA